jgi:Holliday junction DNA helicase RuvB
VGQAKLLKLVLRRQDGALARGEPTPHHLFIGPSGLGKSLAARELSARAHTGMVKLRSDETVESIVQELCRLQPCDFAFVDEAHRLKAEAQELLYEVIDHGTVPPKLVAGSTGREPVKVSPITLVFATDQPGHLLNALFKRIPAVVHFQPYPEKEMREIVARIATRRNLLLSPQAAGQLARVCHGIPRRAEHRVNDVRLYFADSERRQLGLPDISNYLRDNGIDDDGMGENERSYLAFLYRNGSASLEAVAGYLGLDMEFVKHQIEQPLRYCDLIIVRQSGRMLTEAGKVRITKVLQFREKHSEEFGS